MEYGLMIALIALSVVTAMSALGSNVKATFNNISDVFTKAMK